MSCGKPLRCYGDLRVWVVGELLNVVVLMQVGISVSRGLWPETLCMV